MKDIQASQETSGTLQSEVHEQEDELEEWARREDAYAILPRTNLPSVHFFSSTTDSESTELSLSLSLSYEMPVSYSLSDLHIGGVTISTVAPKSLGSTGVNHFQSERSLGINSIEIPKRKTLSFHASETAVTGDGEDYFLSLFASSKKLTAHPSHTKKTCKHFSMILEEVNPCSSSALGDIKIAEVNTHGLFVRLINSSLDKELEIGNHILQQKLNGKTVTFYRFLPNIIMQANSTVTVWAAASEGKHQPPSDFLWKEENKFRTSPNCMTILCKPNSEAIAWYTPVHWKQSWEKLETDIEFERCSIVSPTYQSYMFHWPEGATTTKKKEDQTKKDTSKHQMEPVQVFLKREKEVPPSFFPTRSPWCSSPSVPAHPYCPLIEPHNTSMAGSSINGQPRPQAGTPDPAQGNNIQIHEHEDAGHFTVSLHYTGMEASNKQENSFS